MDDDDFKRQVLEGIFRLSGAVADVGLNIDGLKSDVADIRSDVAEIRSDVADLKVGQRRHSDQLSAIVARLDEQDTSMDTLAGKVDRLQIAVNGAVEASAQALTSIMNLSRRMVRL
jgi:outer membrane murein-binding lipoprotein Lpp